MGHACGQRGVRERRPRFLAGRPEVSSGDTGTGGYAVARPLALATDPANPTLMSLGDRR
jgi:hypothetical protein